MRRYRALQIMLEICEGVKAPKDPKAIEAYHIIYDMLKEEIGERKDETWEAWPKWMNEVTL